MDVPGSAVDGIQEGGPLFELVQLAHLFEDSKRFTDSRAIRPAEEIEAMVRDALEGWTPVGPDAPASGVDAALAAARALDELAGRLRRVIYAGFAPPDVVVVADLPEIRTMDEHIEAMWDRLTRPPLVPGHGSTLISVPRPYVVPGGRYVEFYYWDSYFTAVGLRASGRHDLIADMAANMADLIDRFGFVPNGTRTYYRSRSQTPFFGFLLGLLAEARGDDAARAHATALEREHAFWTTGRRVVDVGDGPGDTLTRYWDDRPEPRPEGYREDRATWFAARDAGYRDDEGGVYRDLRAAAESGWDFSTRWLVPGADGRWDLATIRTTSVVPVDLNALLYATEMRLGDWLDGGRGAAFRDRAARRRDRLCRPPFWDPDLGWFHDALIGPDGLSPSPNESLAGTFPLFCGLADADQAARVADRLREVYLKPGGLVTSPARFASGQQWDYPNGWAPLQWVAVAGLCRYGHVDLAREVARRFVDQAARTFVRTGAMMEKYDVCDPNRPAVAGEYPNQQGFGWTNGVIRAFREFLGDPPETTPPPPGDAPVES